MAGNVKIASFEKIALLLHPHSRRSVPFGCYVYLTLDGKLCLRDYKTAAFVEFHYPLLWLASLENVIMCTHTVQDIFDWLNPISLGTMPASAYIENVA